MKIKVNQETVNYLQRLHFEVEGRADILQRIIEAHAMDEDTTVIDSKPFARYQKEYSELKTEYELAKQEMAKKFLPDELAGKNVPWTLDFATGIMVVNR